MTVALASLCSIDLYSTPVLHFWHIGHSGISNYYMLRYMVPISAGKVVAVVSAYISVWKVPVSYAQTVKATMPLFAVISARIVLNERQSKRVYLSLIPIITGVTIATFTEISFNVNGLLSALLSTGIYAVLNEGEPLPYEIWFLFYLLLSGLLAFLQNLCAFTLIHRLSALSYAVANATKRITVISASLLMLRNPVTVTNVFGMFLSIFGVYLYNRVSHSPLFTFYAFCAV
ncbi:unnamed protein product [Gongylonema pulchrum]|uniref:TPT domain-containing protein n=1 Tax=Gongylonema pulchrum TaxID=637853 RepID=A0A183CY71_9BILA|nr:unnamed protein product [Gongylonema pulchrum]